MTSRNDISDSPSPYVTLKRGFYLHLYILCHNIWNPFSPFLRDIIHECSHRNVDTFIFLGETHVVSTTVVGNS